MKKTVFSVRRAQAAVLCGLLFAVMLSFTRFDASCEALRRHVLRLHIIANSDSAEDQQIKLAVRDRILEKAAVFAEGQTDRALAEEAVRRHLPELEREADAVLAENGYAYTARVTIEDSFFETREYEAFTLPAGTYRSVMVRLGQAKGKNWWCVVFPAVCIPAAAPQARLSDAVPRRDAAVAEHPERYEMRFKAVEWYEDLKKFLNRQ